MEKIIDLDNEIIDRFAQLGYKENEIKKSSPLEFLGVLMEIGTDYFFMSDALTIKRPLENNAYYTDKDPYKLYLLCNEYIRLSMKYNKIISYKDFSDLIQAQPHDIYNYKHIKIFKEYNINILINDYINNIDIYNNLFNDYINTKDINVYNNILLISDNIYNIDKLNYIRHALINNLLSKAPQSLYKKMEGTGQGFSYALMINNNPEYQLQSGTQVDNTISLDSIKNTIQIAQKKGSKQD